MVLCGCGVADVEPPSLHHDLDALAGTWIQDDAFDKAIEPFEQTDEAMWR